MCTRTKVNKSTFKNEIGAFKAPMLCHKLSLQLGIWNKLKTTTLSYNVFFLLKIRVYLCT